MCVSSFRAPTPFQTSDPSANTRDYFMFTDTEEEVSLWVTAVSEEITTAQHDEAFLSKVLRHNPKCFTCRTASVYICLHVRWACFPCVPHHGSSFILCMSTFFISFLPSLYSIPLLLFPFTAHMSLPFCLTPSSISLHILLFSNPHSPLSLIHLTSSLPSSLILFPHFLSPSLTLLPPFLQSGFHHKDAPDGNVSKGKKMTKDEQKSFDEVHA